MKKKKKNLNYELLKKKNYKKNELKYIILKSIFHNQNVFFKKRIKVLKDLVSVGKKKTISFQKNICFITGKYKSNWGFFKYSRHTLKKLNLSGNIINLKKHSW